VLEGRIEPGRVFDRTVDLDRVPDGYRAMADGGSIKVMVTPSAAPALPERALASPLGRPSCFR
jgi:hypothetical protein